MGFMFVFFGGMVTPKPAAGQSSRSGTYSRGRESQAVRQPGTAIQWTDGQLVMKLQGRTDRRYYSHPTCRGGKSTQMFYFKKYQILRYRDIR